MRGLALIVTIFVGLIVWAAAWAALGASLSERSGHSENGASPKGTAVGKPTPLPTPPLRSERPRLYIPVLGLHTYVRNPSNLSLGPAWWPTTGRPGGGDTVAIAGHRITHTHPFYYLDRLRSGDRVYLSARGRDYTYTVVKSYVRPASDMHIADAVGRERLLLTACTPRGSAAFRLVVQARLTGVR